jgi:hypothetical protein
MLGSVSDQSAPGRLPVLGDGAPWPVVIVGAGAAGLMAAIWVGRAGSRALVLESRAKPGAKIRVSGGGRCNVLPSAVELDDFHTAGSRNALKNVLASWPLRDVRAFFEGELGIAMKVEPTGKVFPRSDDPKEILHALLRELERAGATLIGGARVLELTTLTGDADGARFELELSSGERMRARSVVVATGGLSLPKTGSDGWGYTAAHKLGHVVLRRYPALVPLRSSQPKWAELAGVALVASVVAQRGDTRLAVRTGDFLFTHKGFSGPVVLDQSHWFTAPGGIGVELYAAWLGRDANAWDALLQQGGTSSVQAFLRDALPRRLATLLLELAPVHPERRLAELPREERLRLSRMLGACPLSIAGDEGYAVAEVTGGGLALDEVATKTLASRRVPGLYFCGEVLDVTGRIGGYNFLWAWVSGRKAGQAAALDR